MTRHTKTPQQRAEENVTALEKRRTRLVARRDHQAEAKADLDREIRAVDQRLEYARQDPALPANQPPAIPAANTPDEPADPGEPDTDEEQK